MSTFTVENVECNKETEKALLLTGPGIDEVVGKENASVWMPKSQVHEDSEVYEEDPGYAHTLIVSEWIAIQKGWI